MYDDQGGLYLADFGGVQRPDEEIHGVVCTPSFIPQEEKIFLTSCEGIPREAVNEARQKIDIFSLGCCLQAAYSNEYPYSTSRLLNLSPSSSDEDHRLMPLLDNQDPPKEIPTAIRTIVDRMCSLNPRERPSLDEVRDVLMQQFQHEEEMWRMFQNMMALSTQ